MTIAAGEADRDRAVCDGTRAQTRRRAVTALLAAGGVGLVGAGAMASWTTTTTATTGTLSAATAAVRIADSTGSVFTAQVPNLLPGDYFHRYVVLHNDGTSTSTFTGKITPGGDLVGAVTAQVDRCSVAWTNGTCGDQVTNLLARTPVAAAGEDVTYGSIGTGSGGVAHVRYRFELSSTAPTSVQGKTGTIAVSVTGDSVGGRDRTGG